MVMVWKEETIADAAEWTAGELKEALENNDTTLVFFGLLFALFVDLLQWILFFTFTPATIIPVVGQVVVLPAYVAIGWMLSGFGSLVMSVLLFQVGGFIKWKVRGALFVATALEFIPGANSAPFYFLCFLWAYRLVQKRRAEAEEFASQNVVIE